MPATVNRIRLSSWTCTSQASYSGDLTVVPGNPDLVDTLEVEPHPFCHPSFYVDGRSGSGAGLPSHSGALQIEVLALRYQLNVLQRSVKRPRLTAADRFLWARLSRYWTGWQTSLVIVKPETVLPGTAKGFGCSGPGRCGAASRDGRLSPRKRGN